jgi:hypothetical protein
VIVARNPKAEISASNLVGCSGGVP